MASRKHKTTEQKEKQLVALAKSSWWPVASARKKFKGAKKKKEQAKKEEVEAEEVEGEVVKEDEDNSGESKAEAEFPLFQKHPFGFQDYLTMAPTQVENKNKKKKGKEKVEAQAENKNEKGKAKVEDDGESTEVDDDESDKKTILTSRALKSEANDSRSEGAADYSRATCQHKNGREKREEEKEKEEERRDGASLAESQGNQSLHSIQS
ncbi:uncharacterized protein [Malus domestica]|uniref:uncharacterized protein n=1 Tax=Malus domestica TaxID=3750 RepID=UPI003976D3E8